MQGKNLHVFASQEEVPVLACGRDTDGDLIRHRLPRGAHRRAHRQLLTGPRGSAGARRAGSFLPAQLLFLYLVGAQHSRTKVVPFPKRVCFRGRWCFPLGGSRNWGALFLSPCPSPR